jgi:hypothetical protein
MTGGVRSTQPLLPNNRGRADQKSNIRAMPQEGASTLPQFLGLLRENDFWMPLASCSILATLIALTALNDYQRMLEPVRLGRAGWPHRSLFVRTPIVGGGKTQLILPIPPNSLGRSRRIGQKLEHVWTHGVVGV